MKKKLPALVCMLSLVLSLLPALSAAVADEEEAKPQYISSAADLISLSAQVDAGNSFEGVSFVMTANIDLGGRSFMPIGTGNDPKKSFSGSFDGGGFTISGLNISGDYICAGLFGKLDGGTVENVVLTTSCRISASAANVGAVVGLNSGIVKDCISCAAVTCAYDKGTANVGGIVGYSSTAGEIIGCTNAGSVSASGANEKNTGGIAGCNKGRLERCVNLGAVSGTSSGGINSAGGVVGFENDGTTQNCYNRADVSGSLGSENNVGGIAGRMSTNFGKLQNSYNTGKLTARGSEASVGGVVGKKLVGTVYYCYYKKSGDLKGIGGVDDTLGNVTGMTSAQMKARRGDAFGAWSKVLTYGKDNGGAGLADALNKGTMEMPEVWNVVSYDNDGYPIISANYWTDAVGSECLYADLSWMDINEGSASDPYVINTAEQLAGLAALVNTAEGSKISGIESSGGDEEGNSFLALINRMFGNGGSSGGYEAESFSEKYIVLGKDIDLKQRLWMPIGDAQHPFKGSFDGRGYEIHGMYVGSERVSSELQYNGLFGYTLGTVSNVKLMSDCSIFINGAKTAGICAGAVAAFNGGTVIGCESYCPITAAECGTANIGGIVGRNMGMLGRVERCFSGGLIEADLSGSSTVPSCIGGIAGISVKTNDIYDENAMEDENRLTGNALISCRNEGKLEITERGSNASALVGGVCGANVLVGSGLSFGSALDGGAIGMNIDSSATIVSCSNLGKIAVTVRAAGARAAVGGVAGAAVNCDDEALMSQVFSRRTGGDASGSIFGSARLVNSYGAGKLSVTLTKGEELLTGGVAGLLSGSNTKVSACFYSSSGIPAGTLGIGTGGADKDGAASAVKVTMTELANALSKLKRLDSYELGSWCTDGTSYPYQSITLLYNANGGTNPPKDNRIYARGERAEISFSSQPTRSEYVFLGWAKSATAATPDFTAKGVKTLTLSDSMTLFAVWQENKPKSKTTTSETKKNADGTTSSISSTVTVAKNGDVTTEKTENITDSAGKTVKTRTVKSFYDSASGAATERIKEKPVTGSATNSAAFIMDDADKVSALPEELSKELRAGSLESVSLTDKKNGTTTQLGWSTDKNGNKSAQSAELSCDKADGTVKLSAALVKELAGGSYEKLDIAAAGGLGLSLPAEALAGAAGAPTMSLKRDGNTVLLSIGADTEVAASAEYAQQDGNSVVVVDCIGSDGTKTRVIAKFADGKVCFSVPVGAEKFEISEIDFPFTDVSASDWFDGVVRQMYGSGLMTGVSETQFAPGGAASRAMLVTMLWRMEGAPASGQSAFADVSGDAWYAAAVSWAAANGIVSGVSANSFAPDAPVTREQLVTILYRWQGEEDDVDELPGLSAFADGASASDYASDALRWAADKGYVAGKNGGVLDPGGSATRSELAAIVARVLGL